MKVKVYVKCAKLTENEEYLHSLIDEANASLADAYNECEKLRTQVDTLNAALEAAYIHQEKLFQEKRDVERELVIAERDLKSLKTKFADACAERDNLTASYKQLVHNYGALQEQATDECADLREQLHDRNARVAELEQRITFLEDQATVHAEEKEAFEDAAHGFDEMYREYQKELAQVHSEKRDWMQSAEQWRIKYETEHKAYEEDKAKADSICKSCDAIYQKTLKERDAYKAQIEKIQRTLNNLTVQHLED